MTELRKFDIDPRIEQLNSFASLEKRSWQVQAIWYPPATVDQIATCERQLGISLPPTDRRFVEQSNGAIQHSLPARRHHVPGSEVIDSVVEMVEYTLDKRRQKFHDWDRLVHVGDHNEGDMLLFDLHALGDDGEYSLFDSGDFPYSRLEKHVAVNFEQYLISYLDSTRSLD